MDQVLLQSLLLQLDDIRDVSLGCRTQEPQLLSLSGCGCLQHEHGGLDKYAPARGETVIQVFPLVEMNR